MSKIMHGVLNMPPDTWSGDDLDVSQRHNVYVSASKLIRNQKLEIEHLKAQLNQLKGSVPEERSNRISHETLTLLRSASGLDEKWLKKAFPCEVAIKVSKHGCLITSFVWRHEDGSFGFDDENFYSMSDVYATLK
jgi:hypothetical protein